MINASKIKFIFFFNTTLTVTDIKWATATWRYFWKFVFLFLVIWFSSYVLIIWREPQSWLYWLKNLNVQCVLVQVETQNYALSTLFFALTSSGIYLFIQVFQFTFSFFIQPLFASRLLLWHPTWGTWPENKIFLFCPTVHKYVFVTLLISIKTIILCTIRFKQKNHQAPLYLYYHFIRSKQF